MNKLQQQPKIIMMMKYNTRYLIIEFIHCIIHDACCYHSSFIIWYIRIIKTSMLDNAFRCLWYICIYHWMYWNYFLPQNTMECIYDYYILYLIIDSMMNRQWIDDNIRASKQTKFLYTSFHWILNIYRPNNEILCICESFFVYVSIN